MFAYGCAAVVGVLLEGRFQTEVSRTARATVTSAWSLFSCSVGIVEMLALGWIGRELGIDGIYMTGAAFVLLVGFWILTRPQRDR